MAKRLSRKKREVLESDQSVSERNSNLIVVGIGASAGGLEALRELLSPLEYNPRLTYVVAQHLSPTHSSMLKTLLSRECKLNVVDLSDGTVPMPDTIYITPPNKDVEIRNGILHLMAPRYSIGPKPSVNRFFSSLAEDLKENCIGIILSGTGADGASGMLAIRTAGGTTMVQEPASAKYDGMPQAAIKAHTSDLILPPGRMGAVLASFAETGALTIEQDEKDSESIYSEIIRLTRELSGFDLSQYKATTVGRRIKRRMVLNKVVDMNQYLDYMKSTPSEAADLARDILISVTEFFRDREAFMELSDTVKILIENVPQDKILRIWVPGCATGEEAYSIAILTEEFMRISGMRRKYQVFASDIDNAATARGRLGRYSLASFENMDPDLRDRYFEKAGSDYVARKPLREHMVFSVHNLILDPPFSRVDLISCRNLLIYFTVPIQKRVLEIFHYALNQDGYLFLGKSETVSHHQELFSTASRSCRLFRKVGKGRIFRPFSISYQEKLVADESQRLQKKDADPLSGRLERLIFQVYGPPSVVVSENDELLHISGEVSPYLTVHSGPAGLNLFDLADERLRAELRALMYKCRREKITVSGGRHTFKSDAGEKAVRVVVRPFEEGSTSLLLISFEQISAGLSTAAASGGVEGEAESAAIRELEHELTTTREHLQTVVEELETSNEELQSVNEELQSSNEELQSTNEELQTTNEEMQSTNEELLTVNDELQSKSHELEILAADLQNIQDSIEIPLIVVDKKLRVTRIVPASDKIVDISETHLGDSVTSIPWRCDLPDFRHNILEVISCGETFECPVQTSERFYQMRILPYYLKDRNIEGAVLVFYDMTELHESKTYHEQSERRLQSLIDNIIAGVITIDEEGRMLSFSRSAERIFGYKYEEVLGRNVSILMSDEYAVKHNDYLQRYISTGKVNILGKTREAEGLRKDGSSFPVEISVNEMFVGKKRIFTGLVWDITERKLSGEAIFREKERAQVTLHSIADAVITVGTDGLVEYMNPIAERLTGWSGKAAAGIPVDQIFKLVNIKSLEKGSESESILAVISNGIEINTSGEVLLQHKEGREVVIEYSAAPIRNRSGVVVGAVLVFRDISDRQEMLNQLAWQAQHDVLTGLINRHEMENRLERALNSAKSFNREHALLYMDLDQFKIVNDTCGHRAGDELLRQIAGHILVQIRHRDSISRLGGDEFCILLENCSLSQAQVIAEKIKGVVQEFRFYWDNKLFKIGASIGVVPIHQNSTSVSEILSDADAACYVAKEKGRNRIQLHQPNDDDLTKQRHEMRWVSNINQVLDDNRFHLYFQLIAPLNGEPARHWEVLIRMKDESGNLILPGVFLPAAERYHLMVNIDRWVVCNALDALKQYTGRNTHQEPPMIAINLSGSSVSEDKFLGFVQDQFSRYGVQPENICFEITETAAIANFSSARDFIREMKKLGCRFALDDFGSGMSSFGYLKNLFVDYLKIDGLFIKDVTHDVVDLAMVESINRIGHLMDIRTIAEFVESQEIADKVRQIGIDYAQGYAVKHPVSMEEFLSAN